MLIVLPYMENHIVTMRFQCGSNIYSYLVLVFHFKFVQIFKFRILTKHHFYYRFKFSTQCSLLCSFMRFVLSYEILHYRNMKILAAGTLWNKIKEIITNTCTHYLKGENDRGRKNGQQITYSDSWMNAGKQNTNKNNKKSCKK